MMAYGQTGAGQRRQVLWPLEAVILSVGSPRANFHHGPEQYSSTFEAEDTGAVD